MADSDGKIVIGIEGDPSGINKSLDAVEKKGKDAAQGIGSAFSAIAGALAGAKIVSAFQSAIAQAGKLEQSMLKVASTARSMGESTSKAQKAAMDLAQDGFLSASQAAQTLSNLMATGLNVDQAKKFITASKDITAFGNTIGDAAQATEDLSLGLLRGSALVIDNASPALKSLANKYQQLVDTQGKTAAAQYAYNEIVKTGAKFQGDAAKYMDTATGAQARYTAATDAASAAVGKSLQPALKEFYSTLTGLVEGFTKWFSGLNEGTQTILVMGAGLVALVPIISAVNGALALIAINPVTLTIMAIVGAVVALGAVMSQFIKSSGDVVKSYESQKSAVTELTDKVKELEKTNKRTLEQEKELAASKAELSKRAKELGLDYDMLVKKLGSYEAAGKAVVTGEKIKANKELAAQAAALDEAERFRAENPTLSEVGAVFTRGAPNEAFAKLSKQERARIAAAGKKINQEDEAVKPKADPIAAKGTETRFLDSANKLKEIEQNLNYTLSTIGPLNKKLTLEQSLADPKETEKRRRINRAMEDAQMQAKAEVNALRSAHAEYIEDKYEADRLALEKQTEDARRASQNLLENDLRLAGKNESLIAEAKEKNEDRLQKIREANARKEGALRAQAFADTLTAASGIGKGLNQIKNGDIAGGAASAFSGASGLGKGLEGLGVMTAGGTASKFLGSLGVAGAVVSAVGGVVSTISDFFGKSDAERAREAAEQKLRDEVALEISKKQEEHQRNMLALQEAQAKLPFENLTRQLRLIDIKAQQQTLSGVDEKTVNSTRLAARQSVIQQTLNEQGGNIAEGALFAGVDSSPESLIKFLNERALKNTSNSIVAHLLDFMGNGTPYGLNTLLAVKAMLPGYKDTTDPEIYSLVDDALTKNIASMQLAGSLTGNNAAARSQDVAVFEAAGAALRNVRSQLPGLVSEVTQDTSRAESLLSVLEQSLSNEQEIKNNTKRTADNTGRLTQMRENNILDLAGGGIRGFGSFFRGAFNSVDSIVNPRMPALATPSAISNSLSVASLTRSWQDRAADGIDSLVKIQTEALRLLAEIAMNTDAQGQVQGSLTSAQLQDIMANIRSRIV